jgi:Big-like domain-containing protein
MTRSARRLASLVGSLLSIGIAFPAHALLERVGPNNPDPRVGSYPAWYQDTTGLALEFCDPLNQAEVDGGWCLVLPGDVVIPEVFGVNFFDEHFYFAGGANLTAPGGVRGLLVLALEAAGNVPGSQTVFTRIRLRLDAVPATGNYRFIHPYGEETFPGVAGGRIFATDDFGIACASFDCLLASRLGPFLVPSATPGGAEEPAIAGPVPGKFYLADPARLGPVTGSTLPDFTDSSGALRNHNIFRIEGPPGSNLGGPGVDFLETTDFSLQGRIFTETMPGRVTVERATYARSGSGQKLDVFASGVETTQGRVPPQPRPAAVLPQLSFFEAPCGATATGVLTAPAGLADVPMLGAGHDFWAQSQPAAIPAAVCVKDAAARDALGNIAPAFFQRAVADEVAIGEAVYDPNARKLSVKAASSDPGASPALTLAGFGALASGQLVVSPLAAPPAKVRVLSSLGGSAELPVTTGLFTAAPPDALVAVVDAFTVNEDSGPQTFDVLANDSGAGGGTVTLVALPRLGTASVAADGKVSYAPRANANGLDAFSYQVAVGGVLSNVANVSVAITPVNDAPVAVDDGVFTVNVNVPSVLPNLLANDTDPDGHADLVHAVDLVQPAAGAFVVGGPDGVVTFTATATGTYTFSYRAQDSAGTSSANRATVTVRAIASDTVALTSAVFRTGQRRWVVSGTDSAPNQPITLTYADGPAAGVVLATVQGDAAGAWTLDVKGVSGVLDPTTLTPRPTRIRATSPLGGSGTATLTIRN